MGEIDNFCPKFTIEQTAKCVNCLVLCLKYVKNKKLPENGKNKTFVILTFLKTQKLPTALMLFSKIHWFFK